MKIRFLADADFNQKIVSGVLREAPEIDFKLGHELKGLPDAQVLAYAAREGRSLVTHESANNASTFWRVHPDSRQSGDFPLSLKRSASDEQLMS